LLHQKILRCNNYQKDKGWFTELLLSEINEQQLPKEEKGGRASIPF